MNLSTSADAPAPYSHRFPSGRVWLTAWMITSLCAVASGAQSSRRPVADLVLVDGKVFTADSTHPWAEAVAIRGERIMAVGTTASVRQLAGPRTREVVLGGRVVIPGINDAHDHVGDVPLPGEFRTSDAPTPNPSFAQVLDSVAAMAARTPAGTWIKTTTGLTILNDTAARRAALDRVANGHPVLLWSWWGHGYVLNTAALHALHIADTAPDPLGGWYERDASGRLTGRLDEYAAWAPCAECTQCCPNVTLSPACAHSRICRSGWGSRQPRTWPATSIPD